MGMYLNMYQGIFLNCGILWDIRYVNISGNRRRGEKPIKVVKVALGLGLLFRDKNGH